jgi:hypothetical protein
MLRAILLACALACALPTAAYAEILPHPQGCPRRAFCGCGASVHLFGRPVRDLYLARNWFRFPRAAPSHNMVAVRRGHVFVLKQHVQGDTWLVFDANSGRRQTRMHHRSIRGLAIVNPMGGRTSYASAARD